MRIEIPDEIVQSLGLSEHDLRVEIACRLFDADVLDKWPAAQLAGMNRVQFEGELHKRGLPILHYTQDMLDEDLAGLSAVPQRSAQPRSDAA